LTRTDGRPPKTPTPSSELRKFGLSVGPIVALLCAFGFWRDSYAVGMGRWIFFAISGALIVLGALAPRSLALPYRAWMAFAQVMNRVMTTLLLTVFFIVIITPVGLLQRLFSKKGLQEPPKPPGESYWRAPDKDPRGKERYGQPF
jgi:hypothetical protein